MKHKSLFILILLLLGVATSSFAVNYATRFNSGTPNDNITIGANQYNVLFSGAAGLTYEGWIKPASLPTSCRIFHFGLSEPGTTAFGMELFADGHLNGYARSGVADITSNTTSTAAGVITAGTWYHVAVVANFASGSKSIRIYVNGVESVANTTPTFTNNTFVTGSPVPTHLDILGRYLPTDIRPYVGLMEEFRVWKYARTLSEIQADMYHEIASPPANLIGYWKFNTGSGTTAYDSSASGKNGTLTSGTDWTDIRAIDVLSSSNPAIPASTVIAGTLKHPIYKFTIVPALHVATLNQVDFTTAGTYAAIDINNLKLWFSTTDDISTASQIGTTITSGLGTGSHSFTSLSHGLSAGELGYYWITSDIKSTATPFNTISVAAVTTGGLSFADGSKIGTAFPGDAQTIDAPLPVELSSFTAVLTVENYVTVQWVTQSETGVGGYYIYRSLDNNWENAEKICDMIDAANSPVQQVYQYTDDELVEEGTYYYWLQIQDLDGSTISHGPTSVYFTTTGGEPVVPGLTPVVGINSIYPNPITPYSVISYTLTKAADVKFKVYNSRGQLVNSFSEGFKADGDWHSGWNGKDSNGNNCPTGIYYIKMQAGKDSSIRKAVIIK